MADENKKADVPAANPAVEEDLDDLDDVLDEFNKSSTTAKPVPASLPSSKSPAAAAAASSSSSATAAPSSDTKAAVEDADDEDEDEDGENMPDLNEDELMRGFEEMMAAMGLGAPGAGAASTSSSGSGAKAGPSGAATAPPADYAEAIRATMAKLRESDTNAASGSSSSSSRGAGADGMGMPSEDELAKIFSALGEGGMGDGGEEGPELAKMLESMMGELLSKDILYEPLKELRDKYPEYFASPAASSISAEDRQRYEAQHRFVSQVVECFEDPIFENGTESEKKAKRAEVQELMDSMQECGQPPKEVVGDMPSELETLGLGGGGGDEQCCIQ
ncbi:unnamed protein product [Tilletia controversa]|uniref:Peroxin-19 n=1 Tax=Tilletia controversa TaxID=13291 RepID=A0A8X7MS63_9BASI|nr:hypothetical protein A4X06_0g4770 [Tilletia controversa]CAD6910130.1 unnamed protein product [Tilletia controversa]CAD6959269.1 unnamed protein product [Tilletia controversa]